MSDPLLPQPNSMDAAVELDTSIIPSVLSPGIFGEFDYPVAEDHNLDKLMDEEGPIEGLIAEIESIFSPKLPGLTDTVEISREPSGAIHIQAENDSDLFFAHGLVHAFDRLWQMDFQRRVAAGRLSEVLGTETIEQDVFQRTLGLYEAAESAYENLSPEVRQVLDDYSAGINAFLDLDLPLPLEFQILGYEPEPWEPVDSLALLKLQSLALSTNFNSELQRTEFLNQGISLERLETIFPADEGDVTILQPEDIEAIPLPDLETSQPDLSLSDIDLNSLDLINFNDSLNAFPEASNAWVVSGERTTTGKPFLANDPHLDLQIPSIWHLDHLKSSNYDVIGATIPGIPGVAIGRNNQIAWGTTNSLADVQDLYILDEDTDYELRQETIEVRDADDVPLTVKESDHGPVISDLFGIDTPLALRWVSLDEVDGTLESFLEINQAQNWEQFNAALETYVAPSLSFVYADVNGDIGYVVPGNIPIRQPGHTGLLPVAGTGEFDWQGFIPFEQLPRIHNPERGYIVTANNRIAPSEYPYPLSFEWAESYRAERITERILSKDKLSLRDMQSIQLDRVSLLFRDFKPILRDLKSVLQEIDPQPKRALRWLNRLLEWDGNTRPGSRNATVFETWYTELVKVPAAELEQEFLDGLLAQPIPRFLLKALTEGDPAFGGSASASQETAAKLFVEVVEGFEGSVPRWGGLHQAVFSHPVLPIDRQVPFGGDFFTVNVGPYDPETYEMAFGPSYRQIVDLNRPQNSRYILPPGQSGDLFSPYFDNLLNKWQQGKYIRMRTNDFPIDQRVSIEPADAEPDFLLGDNGFLSSQVENLELSESDETNQVSNDLDQVDLSQPLSLSSVAQADRTFGTSADLLTSLVELDAEFGTLFEGNANNFFS